MSLRTYQEKRHFDKTGEPRGGAVRVRKGAKEQGKELHFVVQKHAASHLHYDFRLELDGVLKSWAIPKGPSLAPADKRLAVQVEDHPIEYAAFEGIIPQGQYGGGTVMVWDQGTWEPTPDEDPRETLKAGKLTFELWGEKLHGKWMLVRMGHAKFGSKPQWLLRKLPDRYARPGGEYDLVSDKNTSVLTRRTIEKIAEEADATWQSGRSVRGAKRNAKSGVMVELKPERATSSSDRAKRREKRGGAGGVAAADIPGAVKAPMPRSLQPQLATLVSDAPSGEEWVHEVKFDGYRMLAFVQGGKARMMSRNAKDWTAKFGRVAAAVAELPVESAILDGEIVAMNKAGVSRFQELQAALKDPDSSALAYYVFDLPYLNGYDLRQARLADRQAALRELLKSAGKAGRGASLVRFSEFIRGHGKDVLHQACKLALEGVVSKRVDAPYTSGRTGAWLKSKCTNRQEMVIAGYTDPQNSREAFGSLLLGYYDKGGKLAYAGKVGTGFDRKTLNDILRRLKPLERSTPAFDSPPRGAEARGVHWVEPKLVAEIEFFEWTRDGSMRHPSFVGLREDKDAREVVRETRAPVGKPKRGRAAATPAPPKEETTGGKRASAPRGKRARPPIPTSPGGRKRAEESVDAVLGVPITHPDRVLYPEQGITKRALAEYYAAISGRIMAHVAGRPLTLVRCPRGQGQQCFYQKNWEEGEVVGSHVVKIKLSSTSITCLVIDDPSGLVWLVQRGVLEMHTWGCTEKNLEHPDLLVFDLDPGPGIGWRDLVRAATTVRENLEGKGLGAFVKTTGGKGLHVMSPIKPKSSWDEVKAFTKSVAEELEAAEPERYIANMSKAKREGKIFVDYLRNGRGATFAAAYCTRARPGAYVSMPITWKEIEGAKELPRFSIEDALARAKGKGKDAWGDWKSAATALPRIGAGGGVVVRSVGRRTAARR